MSKIYQAFLNKEAHIKLMEDVQKFLKDNPDRKIFKQDIDNPDCCE